MSSEVETSRGATSAVSQRDSSTPLGMTKIALIQMGCGAEPEKNFSRAIEFIRDAARKGAQIACLPELFRSQYFCQAEDHKNFDLAEEVPGESTAALGEIARETGTMVIASLFERRSAGLYHNTAAIIDADGKLLGNIGKCIFPMIRSIMRNSISHRAISGFRRGKPSAATSVSVFAGTNGTLKRRG